MTPKEREVLTPEASLRGQATQLLRDTTYLLREAATVDDLRDRFGESDDRAQNSIRHLAALCWIRREKLIEAARVLTEAIEKGWSE